MQRVYCGERAQRGRFREFYQCDIDVIGQDTLSPRHDAEIPAVIASAFDALADRKSVVWGKSASVGLYPGCRRINKKKKRVTQIKASTTDVSDKQQNKKQKK